ncbi:MAG: arsenate reductase ArsC [Bacteroidota bacterium]
MKNVLILCTGNSCRSQMAEAYVRHFHGDTTQVYSAGVETHGLNPRAVQAMQEDGIDITHHTSNHVDEYLHISFDLVVTVCDHAADRCPVFPGGTRKIHQPFSDPAKLSGSEAQVMQGFREVRDNIKQWAAALTI